MKQNEQRRLQLVTIGRTLYGDRFGAPLAAKLGVDQSLVSMIAAGRRAVSEEIARRLVDFLSSEIDRRHTDLRRLQTSLVSVSATIPRPAEVPHFAEDLGGGSKIIVGDALQALRQVPEETVSVCVTSPPYYKLRDYGNAGQLGQEDTVDRYLAGLVAIFREVRRALRPDGTIWIVVGDTYATRKMRPDIKPKDLLGIPWRLATALRSDGWYLRQSIIWEKTNGMPESVTDRTVGNYEHVFLLAKSKNYRFDHEAIMEPAVGGWNGSTFHRGKTSAHQEHRTQTSRPERVEGRRANAPALLRARRSVWRIPTTPSAGPHLATFPLMLAEICIRASTMEGDLVLDPFAGTGTTGIAAAGLSRRSLMVELNPEYAAYAKRRYQERFKAEH